MNQPREIEVFNSFKRNAKKHFEHLISAKWAEVITCLVQRVPLPEKYRDHALQWIADKHSIKLDQLREFCPSHNLDTTKTEKLVLELAMIDALELMLS